MPVGAAYEELYKYTVIAKNSSDQLVSKACGNYWPSDFTYNSLSAYTNGTYSLVKTSDGYSIVEGKPTDNNGTGLNISNTIDYNNLTDVIPSSNEYENGSFVYNYGYSMIPVITMTTSSDSKSIQRNTSESGIMLADYCSITKHGTLTTSVDVLPPGLTLASNVISGTPTTLSTTESTITFNASNSYGDADPKSMTFTFYIQSFAPDPDTVYVIDTNVAIKGTYNKIGTYNGRALYQQSNDSYYLYYSSDHSRWEFSYYNYPASERPAYKKQSDSEILSGTYEEDVYEGPASTLTVSLEAPVEMPSVIYVTSTTNSDINGTYNLSNSTYTNSSNSDWTITEYRETIATNDVYYKIENDMNGTTYYCVGSDLLTGSWINSSGNSVNIVVSTSAPSQGTISTSGVTITGTAGTAISQINLANSVTVSNGNTPSFTGSVPAGLSMTSAGIIDGTPSTADNGTYDITVSATNCASALLVLSANIAAAQGGGGQPNTIWVYYGGSWTELAKESDNYWFTTGGGNTYLSMDTVYSKQHWLFTYAGEFVEYSSSATESGANPASATWPTIQVVDVDPTGGQSGGNTISAYYVLANSELSGKFTDNNSTYQSHPSYVKSGNYLYYSGNSDGWVFRPELGGGQPYYKNNATDPTISAYVQHFDSMGNGVPPIVLPSSIIVSENTSLSGTYTQSNTEYNGFPIYELNSYKIYYNGSSEGWTVGYSTSEAPYFYSGSDVITGSYENSVNGSGSSPFVRLPWQNIDSGQGGGDESHTYLYTVSNASINAMNGDYWLSSGTADTTTAVYTNGSYCIKYTPNYWSGWYICTVENVSNSPDYCYIDFNGSTDVTSTWGNMTVTAYNSGGGGGTPSLSGSGTLADPYIWETCIDSLIGTTSGCHTIEFSTGNYSSSRVYVRIGLSADVTYQMLQTGNYDTYLWLYDSTGNNELASNNDITSPVDGYYPENSGSYFTYTPNSTGYYLIVAGGYGGASGAARLHVYPKPIEDVSGGGQSGGSDAVTVSGNPTYNGTYTLISGTHLADNAVYYNGTYYILKGGMGWRINDVNSGAGPGLCEAGEGNPLLGTWSYGGVTVSEGSGGGESQGTISTSNPSTISGTAGTAISQVDLSNYASAPNNQSCSFSADSLPAGLTLTSAGILSGTPSSADSNQYTVTVSATGCTDATITLTFNIAASGGGSGGGSGDSYIVNTEQMANIYDGEYTHYDDNGAGGTPRYRLSLSGPYLYKAYASMAYYWVLADSETLVNYANAHAYILSDSSTVPTGSWSNNTTVTAGSGGSGGQGGGSGDSYVGNLSATFTPDAGDYGTYIFTVLDNTATGNDRAWHSNTSELGDYIIYYNGQWEMYHNAGVPTSTRQDVINSIGSGIYRVGYNSTLDGTWTNGNIVVTTGQVGGQSEPEQILLNGLSNNDLNGVWTEI